MGVFSRYHFAIALLIIASTLLLQCHNASASMTMRKLAGSLPRRPPSPYGSTHRSPIFRSPPPQLWARFPQPPPAGV
ncbi:hypothetical protein K1719_023868 [Acacia pycnantha]|nr:hypothetical protein K1719_023868 [Acacia pycnantha]